MTDFGNKIRAMRFRIGADDRWSLTNEQIDSILNYFAEATSELREADAKVIAGLTEMCREQRQDLVQLRADLQTERDLRRKD